MTHLIWGMVLLFIAAMATMTMRVQAQGPSAPPPSCDEQLNNEMFQKGGIIQQLAVARAQLAAMTKERDDAKTALAKATPKPAVPAEKQ